MWEMTNFKNKSGEAVELQELEHRPVHLPLHPAVPILLGGQPQPGLVNKTSRFAQKK